MFTKVRIFLLCVMAGILTFNVNMAPCCYAQEKVDSEYRVNTNDLLEISVYQEPDLSKTLRVAADGTISYPFLGNIPVVGLTAKELETKLTELLVRDYLINPQVGVFLKEYAKISVLGQINRPGSYELKADLTVMDAIALAGGFTEKANAESIELVRIKGAEKETIRINANEIVGKKEKDITLKSGDLIVVGGLSEASNSVSILGQVRSPGIYNWKKDMTVIDVIALAGGFTDVASGNGTKVIRDREGKREVIRVPVATILEGGDKTLDVTLEPNDTVVVPESFF